MIDFDKKGDKDTLIKIFRYKPTDHKAYRLFQWYGTDLPEDVIEFLQKKVEKLADNIEDNKKAQPFVAEREANELDASIFFCHCDIEDGEPAEKTYEKFAEILGVGMKAFRTQYKKMYPTETL